MRAAVVRVLRESVFGCQLPGPCRPKLGAKQRGFVVCSSSGLASRLLDSIVAALIKGPMLAKFDGVSDSGEGRWTINAAIDEPVSAWVRSTAHCSRLRSRGRAEIADKLLSAMRFEFGGHGRPVAPGTPLSTDLEGASCHAAIDISRL